MFIYFTQGPHEIIYFKNTSAPPPCRVNGGPIIADSHPFHSNQDFDLIFTVFYSH